MSRRLLILACSGRKAAHPSLAIDLYQGPAFRVVTRFRNFVPVQHWPLWSTCSTSRFHHRAR